MDTKPRALSEQQLDILDDMAELVVDEFKLRRAEKFVLNENEK